MLTIIKFFLSVDHERFKNISSGLLSITILLSVVVGGVWAGSKYILLQDKKLVQLDIQEKERRLNEGAALEIIVNSEQILLSNDKRIFLHTTVEIRNKGNRTARILYDSQNEKPLLITRIEFDSIGVAEVKNAVNDFPRSPNDTEIPLLSHFIEPNAIEYIKFINPLPSAGLYRTTYSATVSRNELSELKVHGISNAARWSGETYTVVTKNKIQHENK